MSFVFALLLIVGGSHDPIGGPVRAPFAHSRIVPPARDIAPAHHMVPRRFR